MSSFMTSTNTPRTTRSSRCSSSTSSHNHKNTLDLHGCTKLQAIEKLTCFLDQIRTNYEKKKKHTNTASSSPPPPPPLFVTIITGSGKHSTHGPVLRQAVQHLFERRQMTFHLNRGKGSFTVDALSGMDLIDRSLVRQVGTKILLVEDSSSSMRDHRHNVAGVKFFSTCSGGVTIENGVCNDSCRMRLGEEMESDELLPTPMEVARDDDLIQQIKTISYKEVTEIQSLEKREKNELQKAVEDSIKILQNDNDDLELERVLVLSKQEHELEQKQLCIHLQQQEEKERDMLTKALEMSLQLEQETEERERLELEKVLALSEKETIGGYLEEEEQEEDFVFLQVLESSKREHHGQPEIMDFEEQLKLALEESVLSL